jgi:Fe-S-cluster-containing dehydrogenase component/CRP-like cAMP-binding protein
VVEQANGESDSLVSLQNIDEITREHQTIQLGSGDMFGELAALSRSSRAATVFAENDVEVLELQWEGLRDIRNKSDEFKTFIDERYRERSLKLHLIESPLFSHLDNEHLNEVVNATLFETHGNFNWFAPFKSMVEKKGGDPLEQEPVIAREGHYVNGLILIRSGFARQSQKFNHGRRTLSYLGRGDIYGLHELVNNWSSPKHVPNNSSLSAMGYVDILRIPTAIVEEYVLPHLPDAVLQEIRRESGTGALPTSSRDGLEKNDGFLEFLVQNRFINGTQAMLIDMDRCTRCDDCVRACAVAHDNNPRFIRHGKRHDNIMVANSCMHCTDPVCMIGCPTGAIHRDPYQGQVVINDSSCIGCGSCASSCPYNNIRLVEIRDSKGNYIINESTHAPVLKATKCDLCVDQPVSPACERACPHDAMIRINICDADKLGEWLNR